VGVILVNVPAQYVLCFYLEAQAEVGQLCDQIRSTQEPATHEVG
jgi:hypothetical protein